MKLLLLLILLSSCNSFKDPATGNKVWIKDVEEDTTNSLEGVDADKDDVRDDVQKWIDLNVKDHNLNMGMKQYVKYKTQGMLVADDRMASRLAQNSSLDTWSCLEALGYDFDEVHALIKKVKVVLINTPRRLKTNGLSEAQLSGSERILMAVEFYLKKCEFKIKPR